MATRYRCLIDTTASGSSPGRRLGAAAVLLVDLIVDGLDHLREGHSPSGNEIREADPLAEVWAQLALRRRLGSDVLIDSRHPHPNGFLGDVEDHVVHCQCQGAIVGHANVRKNRGLRVEVVEEVVAFSSG